MFWQEDDESGGMTKFCQEEAEEGILDVDFQRTPSIRIGIGISGTI